MSSDTDVVRYIRERYPDCPYSDASFRMCLMGLSATIGMRLESGPASTEEPSLYKLVAIGSG